MPRLQLLSKNKIPTNCFPIKAFSLESLQFCKSTSFFLSASSCCTLEMSEQDSIDPGYALLRLEPSFRPAFEVRVAIGVLLNPNDEAQWNNKDILWTSAITDVTFLLHSLFWEYIKATIPEELGGVLGSANVKFIRYVVCYATIHEWRNELCDENEILVGVFHAKEHFTIIMKNCNVMAGGGEVLISAAEVTDAFHDESEELLPGRTIVESELEQGDGDVCGACVSLILKELMGFPLGQESVENIANVSTIYLARLFFAHLYLEGSIKIDEFDEDFVISYLLGKKFLPRSHPLFCHDKRDRGLGGVIHQLHENVMGGRKKLRQQRRDSKKHHTTAASPKKRSSSKNNLLEKEAKQQNQQPRKRKNDDEMGNGKATKDVATKSITTILEMPEMEDTLFDSEEDIPLPKRPKKSQKEINHSLFGDSDSGTDNEDCALMPQIDNERSDNNNSEVEDNNAAIIANQRITRKSPENELLTFGDPDVSFSNRNLSVICDVDWQPDPHPNASLLPEVNNNEMVDHSQLFMSDPKATGKALRFGSMYFVVLQGRESVGMTVTGVKDLLSTLFHPVRPASPFVCHNCSLQFWNPVLHLEHLRSNWNCKNVRISKVNRVVKMNPRTVNPLYFVIDFEVYIFLQMAVQQLDPAHLPLDTLNPCHYPLPAPCGGRPLPHPIIQEEVKREHEQLMKLTSFYDLHTKKLKRLLKLSSLYKNSTKCKDWMRDRFTQYPLFLTMPFLNSNCFPDAILVPKSASTKKSKDTEEMDDCKKFIVAFATTGEVDEHMLSLLE